jgi:hypothetical protein
MIVRFGRFCSAAGVSFLQLFLLAAIIAAAPLSLGGEAWAQQKPLRLLKTIPINGTAANRSTQLFSFDISWVDAANGLYYLADRSNAAVEVVDTTGAFTGTPDTLFGQIGGSAFGFAGDTGTTATSGPNGVVAAFPCIFVTDGPSRVVSINAAASFVTPVSSINTGGQFRADEIAYDPKDGILLAANNADTPPFGTLITVNKSTCALSNPIKSNIDAAHGVNATNGAEQPVWDPTTQRFYVSIPEINGPGGGGPNGGVVRVNPFTGVLENFYQVNFCQPAGLTVGPNGDLLVGCNTVFDFSGNACTAIVVPANGSTATPATCKGVANPQSAVCNPGKGCSGNSLVAVPGVGGGDEIFFNSGDGNYYVTASNNPIGPTLGVVASGANTPANTLVQLIPTLPPVNSVTTGSVKHGAGTVHSVAASSANNHVYVALPSNTSYPSCTQGCIAVFGTQ